MRNANQMISCESMSRTREDFLRDLRRSRVQPPNTAANQSIDLSTLNLYDAGLDYLINLTNDALYTR